MKKSLLFLVFNFISFVIFSQGITNNGTIITITSPTYLTISGTGGNYTNNTFGGSALGRIDLDGVLRLAGNWKNNSGSAFINVESTPGGTIIFQGNNAQTIEGSAITGFENFEINKSGNSVSILASTVSLLGHINIIGGTFDANNQTLNVGGNWTNNATFLCDNSTVVFNGASTQTNNPGNSDFFNVRFANTTTGNNDIIINQPMTINGSATFSEGIINFTGTGSLTFGNTATSDGGSANSFVNGTVAKKGSTSFIFPVGEVTGSDIAIWAPVGIGLPLSTSTITADYDFFMPPNNLGQENMCGLANIDHVSGTEHWDMTSNSETPPVTLYWKSASRSGITNLTDLLVAHWENCPSLGADKWVSKGGVVVDEGGGQGYITSTFNFDSYSNPITFGTKNNTNPLPIELLEFTCSCADNGVLLKWATASETNNDYFTVERSDDASIWEKANDINGAGNSNQIINYNYTDNHIANNIVYYRLKQTDFNGQFEYSVPISIQCDGNFNGDVVIYPNPFNETITLDISNFNYPQAQINIFDVIGRKVSGQSYTNIVNNRIFTSFDLSEFADGMYFLVIHANDYKKNFKIIKKQ